MFSPGRIFAARFQKLRAAQQSESLFRLTYEWAQYMHHAMHPYCTTYNLYNISQESSRYVQWKPTETPTFGNKSACGYAAFVFRQAFSSCLVGGWAV